MSEATPPDAVVAVVSRGDPRLLEIEGRNGWHFPHDADGRYAGFYPKTSEDALARVESLRGAGARFLCFPATAVWWLEHYRGLADWLAAHCHVAVEQPGICVVYDLLRPPGAATAASEVVGDAVVAQMRSLLSALLPEGSLVFVVGAELEGLAAPGRSVASLGPSHAIGLRRLTALKADRPTFVLVPRDASVPPPNPALEGFLARRTDPVASRQGLCDLLRVRTPRRVDPRPGQRDLGSPSGSEAPSEGELAASLAQRLERLGLPGLDSSEESVRPISHKGSI